MKIWHKYLLGGALLTLGMATSIMMTTAEQPAIVAHANENEDLDMFGSSKWELSSDGTLTLGAGQLDMYDKAPWSNDDVAEKIKKIKIDKGVIAPKDSTKLFSGLSNLVTIDGMQHLNTSNVSNMHEMFSNDWKLLNLELSNFDTIKVTNMSGMFEYNKSIVTLDLSHFITSNVTDMSGMFYGDFELTKLDLSSFDNSKSPNTGVMFLQDIRLWKLKLGSKTALIPSVFPNSLPVPVSDTLFSDNNQTYKVIGNNWREIGDGTEHAPLGDIVTSDKVTGPGTFVWNHFSKVPVTKPVKYVDDTNKVVANDTISGNIGDKNTYSVKVPDGYQLADKQPDKVDYQLIANNDPLIIKVTKKATSTPINPVIPSQPITPSNPTLPTLPVDDTAKVTINYIDDNGNTVKVDYVNGQLNHPITYHTVSVSGYEVLGGLTREITPTSNGYVYNIPITRVYNHIQKKMAVIMNNGGYLYKTTDLSKDGSIKYKMGTRQQRPMFVVSKIVDSKNGILYQVRDSNAKFVNSNKQTNGKVGYIKATKNVVPAYYSTKRVRSFKVINQWGINAYKNVNLTKKIKHYKYNSKVKVVGQQKHNLTTRYKLSNGTYITANKKMVTIYK
ncbi:BspA family leucine-rich repeat surface protein [Lentilactobacillus sp. SPB1-3]|uniref:BspA family leucine-rich repeat surface protein n=1 Tax=Lentilactobacillus terminaliae TaxID=3003483 RepID=A0ACD5DEY3_9LACO|nr:BspA family leucine-rich repeat surface protein [Lentilactobacillus sp. SPB1-3]MCZ0977669.1 BspA family leucine-rich repeat surface protein [Lentilactobacillus sp. SPB1-3]